MLRSAEEGDNAHPPLLELGASHHVVLGSEQAEKSSASMTTAKPGLSGDPGGERFGNKITGDRSNR